MLNGTHFILRCTKKNLLRTRNKKKAKQEAKKNIQQAHLHFSALSKMTPFYGAMTLASILARREFTVLRALCVLCMCALIRTTKELSIRGMEQREREPNKKNKALYDVILGAIKRTHGRWIDNICADFFV